MTDMQTTRQIEEDLARDRAALAETFDRLGERLSPERMTDDTVRLIRDNLGAGLRAVDAAVRANPLALALAGAGVAWLVFGARRGDPSRDADVPEPPIERWESEGGRVVEDDQPPHLTQQADARDSDWSRRLGDLRRMARVKLSRISRGARHAAADRAAVVAEFTREAKTVLASGLDGLDGAARDRVVAAREAAYAAVLKAEEAARKGTRATGRMVEDHPLEAGALALALGASLAAMLPRTEAEDRAFGAESDRLMAEALRVLKAERDRALAAAATVGGELKGAVVQAAAAAGDELADAATRATRRAADPDGTHDPHRVPAF